MCRMILFLLFLLGNVTAGEAATLYVRPDGSGGPPYYPTIQAAINASHTGDVIRLLDGVFTGAGNRDVDFGGKAVTVRSDSNDPARVTVDCQDPYGDPHRGFVFDSQESSASRLQAITITNGWVDGQGGAISCVNASPTISGCVFRLCTASEGGAIAVNVGSPLIADCTFDNCYVSNLGGAIFYFHAGGTLRTSTLDGCTFYQNDGIGACLACQNSSVQVTNTIMAFSTWGEPVYGAMSAAALSCCDVYGNASGDWVGCIAGQQGIEHNRNADPHFCLQMTSPHPFRLYDISPCAPDSNPACGLIGAWDVGCDVPVITLLAGHEFQDGFGQNSPQFLDPLDVGNADVGFDVSGDQAGVNDWLGDSAVVAGPPVVAPEDRWLARLCFRIARKGPMQDQIPAYQQWRARLPGNPEQGFVGVLMDSVETGGVPRADSFATYFREGQPGYLTSAPDLCAAQEILPDGAFTPGTQIEYYYVSFLSNGQFQAPEQYRLGPLEFGILPGMRWSGGAEGGQREVVWPSVLYVDASDDVPVPEWQDPAAPRVGTTQVFIGEAFDRLGIPYDRYDYGGASADWNAPLARSFGGTGHNPGQYGNNGCALMQLLGYRLLLINTGTKDTHTMEAADFDMINTWLATSICDITDYRRGLILNGDAIGVILNEMETPPVQPSREVGRLSVSGQQLMEGVLGVHVSWYNPHGYIAPEFCIFLEADAAGPNVIPVFEPDQPLLAAYGDGDFGPCHFAYSILDTVPGADGVVGNLSYRDYQNVYHDFAQVATSRTQGTNWRSIVDGFSLAHLVNRSIPLSPCDADSSSTKFAIDLLFRPELEWIMGEDPEIALALWNYPCTATSAVPEAQHEDATKDDWRLECGPSPCTSRALLRLHVPAPAEVRLDVYDAAGRLVRAFEPERVAAGVHDVVWDGCGQDGKPAPSGVYWVRARGGPGRVSLRKLIVVR
jgi:hypothetical protein